MTATAQAAPAKTIPAIGQAYGGRVIHAPALVHGKSSPANHTGHPLFTDVPNPFQVGRYHSLAVHEEGRNNLPFAVTARTSGGEVMALAFHDRPWVGVQFHPESVLTPDGPKLLNNFIAMCDTAKE